ncbi:MAG: hypothetical protein ABJL57_11990 [Hyphomonas sp.]|uniref:hypothetical protein n=1 Tax=Hyphomonas sp. TaxID=87 RepID=UPI003274CC9C
MKPKGKITDADASAKTALEIMRGWEWGFIDYDGKLVAYGNALNVVVSKLGMAGLAQPHEAVLSLLCHGDLVARGDFHWQKYDGGSRHRLRSAASIIIPHQWITIASIIETERKQLSEGKRALKPLDLPRLGMTKCPAYDWAFNENRIGTASRSAGDPEVDDNNVEEWFSAWEIEVWPRSIFDGESETPSGAVPSPLNKGGAPRKWDWDGAMLHLAALAHHEVDGLLCSDGRDPNQSDIAGILLSWFIDNGDKSPQNSQLRHYGKRFVSELNAIKMRDASNPKAKG